MLDEIAVYYGNIVVSTLCRDRHYDVEQEKLLGSLSLILKQAMRISHTTRD